MSKETLEEFREKPESDWEWMMFPNKVLFSLMTFTNYLKGRTINISVAFKEG